MQVPHVMVYGGFIESCSFNVDIGEMTVKLTIFIKIKKKQIYFQFCFIPLTERVKVCTRDL